jgi:hypothetical protein
MSMTPEKFTEMERKLDRHGLTVLLTRDYVAMLIQLARLAQFERLMIQTAAGNPAVEFAVEHVKKQQLRIIQ